MRGNVGEFFDYDGLVYQSLTGRRYEVLEGFSISSSWRGDDTQKASDRAFIVFDDSNEEVNNYMVGSFWGASALKRWETRNTCLETIESMVAEYENENFNVPHFIRTEIDLGGPTDTLIAYFIEKLTVDMHRNRDIDDIPCMASVNAEVLTEINKRAWDNECHFYLCVSKTEIYDDECNYEWSIVDTFDELVAHKNDGIEFYEIIVADDPYLYEIKF